MQAESAEIAKTAFSVKSTRSGEAFSPATINAVWQKGQKLANNAPPSSGNGGVPAPAGPQPAEGGTPTR